MSLSQFGRRSFVSLTGLESILKDIESHGLPKAHSRTAREKQIEEY